MQGAAGPSCAESSGQAELDARARDVIHFVLLARAGQIREELRGVQIPRLEIERSEADAFTRGGAAGAQGIARFVETVSRRAEERDQPNAIDTREIGLAKVLLGPHRYRLDEKPRPFRPRWPDQRLVAAFCPYPERGRRLGPVGIRRQTRGKGEIEEQRRRSERDEGGERNDADQDCPTLIFRSLLSRS
jgi:hypothetical protein